MSSDGAPAAGSYGSDSDIVDFILGITFEIWEQRGVDLIHRYYAPDVEVFSLEGLISGAQAMVDGTRATLKAFPDRLLIGENVVWSGDRESGFYSSHRITSPMTNLGRSPFGPASGRRVHITNIADCVVENGVITREWLLRDNLSLVRQLGIDEAEAARGLSDRLDSRSRDWLQAEALRVRGAEAIAAPDHTGPAEPSNPSDPRPTVAETKPAGRDGSFDPGKFAGHLLTSLWHSGEAGRAKDLYAPYAVLHRSPVERYSGRDSVLAHYGHLQRAFGNPRICLDHVACQPFGSAGWDIAGRWALAGQHADTFAGSVATGKPVFVLGASHWRIAAGRIVAEWTVFDQLAVLGQLLD